MHRESIDTYFSEGCLVVIAFGSNDAGVNNYPSYYRELLEKIGTHKKTRPPKVKNVRQFKNGKTKKQRGLI